MKQLRFISSPPIKKWSDEEILLLSGVEVYHHHTLPPVSALLGQHIPHTRRKLLPDESKTNPIPS